MGLCLSGEKDEAVSRRWGGGEGEVIICILLGVGSGMDSDYPASQTL